MRQDSGAFCVSASLARWMGGDRRRRNGCNRGGEYGRSLVLGGRQILAPDRIGTERLDEGAVRRKVFGGHARRERKRARLDDHDALAVAGLLVGDQFETERRLW